MLKGRRHDERGEAETLEFVILVPFLLALIALVVAAGVIALGNQDVQGLAALGSQSSVMQQNDNAASVVASSALAGQERIDQGITCDSPPPTEISYANWAPNGSVTTKITCKIATGGLVPGEASDAIVSDTSTAPISYYDPVQACSDLFTSGIDTSSCGGEPTPAP